jgi:hypothetical protein
MSLAFLKDVPEFKELVRALDLDEPEIRISGLTPSAKPFFVAALAEACSRPVVFVQPAEFSLSGFEERAGFFFSELGSNTPARFPP